MGLIRWGPVASVLFGFIGFGSVRVVGWSMFWSVGIGSVRCEPVIFGGDRFFRFGSVEIEPCWV